MKLILSNSLLFFFLSSIAIAQPASVDNKLADIRKTTLTPVLDGVLDDAIWQESTKITDLHQTQPVDHGEPSEESEFYISYDENNFYVAARFYDSEPDLIRAQELIQGQSIFNDDNAYILLDTFNNNRTAFYFRSNPNGVRNEGVWESASNFNGNWSGIWQTESRVDELGWTTEMIIPFTTLNFDPNTDEWGMNLGRTISRKNERLFWSSFNRNSNPSTAGQLRGINDIRQGLGLDIVPSITVAQAENHLLNNTSDRVDPTLDIFYKFTPNLTGALTFNTDFSATEVDNRQVNLTRFSLFFPEKRDFFLQDSEIFSFGNIGNSGLSGAPGAKTRNGIPFYSRRIGLDPASGQPVDIDAGGKLAGRIGDFSIGAMTVKQGDRIGLTGQDIFVGRITSNVLSESRIGAIFTEGDPNSETDNSLAGVDFTYRNTDFSESHTVTSDFWYQQTDTEGLEGDDKAYSASLTYATQNTGLNAEADYSYFGNEYNPVQGFANRRGIERAALAYHYLYLPDSHPFIRNLQFLVTSAEHISDVDSGLTQSQRVFIAPIGMNTHRGDLLFVQFEQEKENLVSPFEIRPGVIIPAGEYSFAYTWLNFAGSSQRNFSPSFSYSQGDFYDGSRREINGSVDWKPNRNLAFEFSYNFTDVELPYGDFVTRLISLNASFAFDSKWSWVNLLQYDNGSGNMGINSRLRWNRRAGEDVYFVVNYNFDSTAGAFEELNSIQSEIVLKYTRNFRF